MIYNSNGNNAPYQSGGNAKVQKELKALQDSINSLTARFNTFEDATNTDIGALQTNEVAQDTNIAGLGTRVSATENKLTELETDVETVNVKAVNGDFHKIVNGKYLFQNGVFITGTNVCKIANGSVVYATDGNNAILVDYTDSDAWVAKAKVSDSNQYFRIYSNGVLTFTQSGGWSVYVIGNDFSIDDFSVPEETPIEVATGVTIGGTLYAALARDYEFDNITVTSATINSATVTLLTAPNATITDLTATNETVADLTVTDETDINNLVNAKRNIQDEVNGVLSIGSHPTNVQVYIGVPKFTGTYNLKLTHNINGSIQTLFTVTIVWNGKFPIVQYHEYADNEPVDYLYSMVLTDDALYFVTQGAGNLYYSYDAMGGALAPTTSEYPNIPYQPDDVIADYITAFHDRTVIFGDNTRYSGVDVLGELKAKFVDPESSVSSFNFMGKTTVADLPAPDFAGDVYNITDNGLTTDDFLEGAGKPINAGDDVIAVDVELEGSEITDGVTWNDSLFPGYDSYADNQFFVHLSNGDTLIFANDTHTGNVIVAKYNGPNDYTFITRFHTDYHSMSFGIQRSDGRIMLFGGGDDYWYSDDLGENWNRGTTVPTSGHERSWIDVQYANGVFVATDSQYGGNYYLASLDNGESWQYIGDSSKQIEYDGYKYGIQAATVLSDGRVLIYASCYDLQETCFFTSTDLNNWTKLPITLSYNDSYSYLFKVNENIMLLISGATEYNPDDRKYYHHTFRINFSERTVEEVALLPDSQFSTEHGMHNRIINATGERIQLADGHYSDNIGTTWKMLVDFPTGEISSYLIGVNQVSTDTLAFVTIGGYSNFPDYLFYQQYSRTFHKWNKFSAGVNYNNFEAENITATHTLTVGDLD